MYFQFGRLFNMDKSVITRVIRRCCGCCLVFYPDEERFDLGYAEIERSTFVEDGCKTNLLP
jgi:hypothetical protein